MRRKSRITLLLAVGLLALGVSAPAGATPVVDQYTEQVPSPGGPVPMKPGTPSIPSSSGTGSGSDVTGTDVSGVGVTNSSGGNGDSGADGKSVGVKKTAAGEEISAGNGVDTSGSGSQPVDGMVTSTGDDDGSGMGWLFPAALILVAGTVAGFAFGRRGRGPAAT